MDSTDHVLAEIQEIAKRGKVEAKVLADFSEAFKRGASATKKSMPPSGKGKVDRPPILEVGRQYFVEGRVLNLHSISTIVESTSISTNVHLSSEPFGKERT